MLHARPCVTQSFCCRAVRCMQFRVPRGLTLRVSCMRIWQGPALNCVSPRALFAHGHHCSRHFMIIERPWQAVQASLQETLPAGGGGNEMPTWMQGLHTILGNAETPHYLRLFLIKVIIHVDRRHADRAASQATVCAPAAHGRPLLLNALSLTAAPTHVHCFKPSGLRSYWTCVKKPIWARSLDLIQVGPSDALPA